MSNKTVLYLPSTPLNILVSVAHALAFRHQQNAVMVIIDQKATQNHLYFECLDRWQDSPFEKVAVLQGVQKGESKLKQRKAIFKHLADLLNEESFEAIATGSDRRVEFQYAMQLGQQQTAELEGWYLDDGLYSYSGRASHWYKDWVNGLLKKVSYGFWWDEPTTVGASRWINQAWLFQPDKAVQPLLEKQRQPIQADWFKAPEMRAFAKELLSSQLKSNEVGIDLDQTEVIVLLPHPSNFKKINQYQTRLESFLQEMQNRQKEIAVKYHPRSGEFDLLNLVDQYGVKLIPSQLAFEVLLLELDPKVQLVGDVGTALLTSKWLRPDIKSYAVLSDTNVFEKEMAKLLTEQGLDVKTNILDVVELIDARE